MNNRDFSSPYNWFSAYLEKLFSTIKRNSFVTQDTTDKSLQFIDQCTQACKDKLLEYNQNILLKYNRPMSWEETSVVEDQIYDILSTQVSDAEDVTGLFYKIGFERERKNFIIEKNEKERQNFIATHSQKLELMNEQNRKEFIATHSPPKLNVTISERIYDYIDKNEEKNEKILSQLERVKNDNPYRSPLNRGQNYQRNKKFQEAIAEYDDEIKLNPYCESAYSLRASAYASLSDEKKFSENYGEATVALENSIKDYTEIKKLNPSSQLAADSEIRLSFQKLIELYFNKEEFDKGFEKIIEIHMNVGKPEEPEPTMISLFRLNMSTALISFYKTSLVNPDDNNRYEKIKKLLDYMLNRYTPKEVFDKIKGIEDTKLQFKVLEYALNEKSPLRKWFNDKVGFFSKHFSSSNILEEMKQRLEQMKEHYNNLTNTRRMAMSSLKNVVTVFHQAHRQNERKDELKSNFFNIPRELFEKITFFFADPVIRPDKIKKIFNKHFLFPGTESSPVPKLLSQKELSNPKEQKTNQGTAR